jgi:hypothetical protein
MNRSTTLIATIAVSATCSTVLAMYDIGNRGDWPESWPKALEPLRKQSRTLIGPMSPHRHYAIPFAKRDEMESAWPHILKVKSKGAPIFLVRGPNFFLGDNKKAGVAVHCPPLGQAENPATPERPIPGSTNARERWMYTNYIDLIVDGDVVDLNRIPLPADTPIIDERFKDSANQ